MKVNVGGQDYEIDGIMYGTLPAWKLVKVEGKPMTGEQFEALPEDQKLALFNHVQAYMDGLNRG